MIQKTLLALAVAAVMASGSAFAQTTIPIATDPLTGISTGGFGAVVGTRNYTFEIMGTGLFDFTAAVYSQNTFNPGFSITNATFDTNSFTQSLNTPAIGTYFPGVNLWTYSATNISAGTHTLSVTGTGTNISGGLGALQFTSAPIVAAVPEPATITMMLAGLALVGGIQLRRKKKLELAG